MSGYKIGIIGQRISIKTGKSAKKVGCGFVMVDNNTEALRREIEMTRERYLESPTKRKSSLIHEYLKTQSLESHEQVGHQLVKKKPHK